MAEFYQHEIAKWNVATDDLTLEQEAAYHRVVGMIRLYERPLKHNLRVLGGMWRCNERKAKRLLDELVEAGKLTLEDGFIVDEKAVKDASNLRRARVHKQSAGRRGGIESGKSRRKPLENNETGEADASTIEENRREEEGDSRFDKSNPPPPSAAAAARDLEDLIGKVAAAVGITAPPAAWSGLKAKAALSRWLKAGLDPGEILRRAAASRAVHPEPPATPQALDSFMRASVPAQTTTPSTPQDRAEAERARLVKLAEWVNSDRHMPANAVTNTSRDAMLEAGLTTPEALRKRGIY